MKTEEETLVADETFVPTLTSEAELDDTSGYKGRKVAELLDEVRDTRIGEN